MIRRPPKTACKKGSILDGFLIVVVLFGVAIVSFFSHWIYTEYVEDIGDELGNDGSEMLQSGQRTINGLDFIFGFIFVGFMLYLMYSTYVIDTRPAFFMLGILVVVILGMFSSLFANAFDDMTNTTEFANETATYPIISHVMTNFPLWIIVMIFLALITIYAKHRIGAR